MFKAFQVKKLVLCSVVALGMVGLANADSIKCDSKEAIIAFATQACELSASEVNELRKNGIYGDIKQSGTGAKFNKYIMLDDKTLTCVFKNEIVEKNRYSKFKTINTDKNKTKCSVWLYQTFDNNTPGFDLLVDFTLQNSLMATDIYEMLSIQ